MAQKLHLLKLLQEIRGFAEVGNRSPELSPLLQASMDLRSAQHATSLPVRRFSIPVSHEHHQDAPSEIPIKPMAGLTHPSRKITRIVFRHS